MGRGIIVRTWDVGEVERLSARAGCAVPPNARRFCLLKDEAGAVHQGAPKNKRRSRVFDFWGGMPEFVQEARPDPMKIEFNVEGLSIDLLSYIFDQPITAKTRSIWLPKLNTREREREKYTGTNRGALRYPVFVISKGRAGRCLTHNKLKLLRVPHKVVVEPVDYDEYIKYIPAGDLLVLPFSDLGEGSTPARNWVLNYAREINSGRHWLLDDNIEDFNRLNRNEKPVVRSNAIFCAAEDFVDRYSNIAQAGFNYYSFCKKDDPIAPVVFNTRVYSCMLLDNNIPFEWRGKYNEDTDLSLRLLKSGYATALFNAFLCGKVTTQRMKGGNTDHVYTDDDERLAFAESLRVRHPDVVKVVRKFNRWHHQVDYRKFKANEPDLISPPLKGVDNYGMKTEIRKRGE